MRNKKNIPQLSSNTPLLSTALIIIVHPKDVDGMANSVDPDLGLHRLVWPNYGITNWASVVQN